MHVGLIGMNYELLDLDLRELFARGAQNLQEGSSFHDVSFVVLFTCNRTEIYFSADDLAEAHSMMIAKLKKDVGEFPDHCLYSYFGEECFLHLAKVTSGISSVIFGESEIQRQVKDAYEGATSKKNLPSSLHFMFQKALKIGKQVRTNFDLPKGNISMESTLWNLICYIFGSQAKDLSILFIGFSEINRKVIPFLKGKGMTELYLGTRSHSAAESFSISNSCKLVNWLEISKWPEYDIVISGSIASQYLLRKDDCFFGEIKNRLVIDLSMPRSADPLIATHPAISLFNIEEINTLIEQRQRRVGFEKEKICKEIEAGVMRQIGIYQEKTKRVFVCA